MSKAGNRWDALWTGVAIGIDVDHHIERLSTQPFPGKIQSITFADTCRVGTFPRGSARESSVVGCRVITVICNHDDFRGIIQLRPDAFDRLGNAIGFVVGRYDNGKARLRRAVQLVSAQWQERKPALST